MKELYEKALELHEELQGKNLYRTKDTLKDKDDLSLYTLQE